ncbi:MAG: FKBP-type peptidyl-prolyl cis-trans isomerase [Saprospiraceae bacterium]
MFAQNLKQSGLTAKDLTAADVAQGLNDALDGNEKIDVNKANATFQEFMQKQAESANGDVKSAGEKFLADNAKREGVKTTASGLQYEILKPGTGASPSATSKVEVHYHGTLIDGTVFDSSVDRGETITFGLNQVIPGWTEGVQLMKEGAKYRFFIPYDLAYGARGSMPKIKPFSALIFDVELFDVK